MQSIDFQFFTVKESYFNRHSDRHGVNHTYRVMVHVLQIGVKAHLGKAILPALCAAFIHDMARRNDGYCTQHGRWAAETKLPEFAGQFAEMGLDDDDLEAVRLAVSNHSLNEEIPENHPNFKIVALLKDADALDRIRISKTNLNPDFLRFPESVRLIPFAEKLFDETNGKTYQNFEEILKVAQNLGMKL